MDSKRIDFVQKCGELLRIAKPHLLNCKLKLGKDITKSPHEPGFMPNEEYVVVTCDNGYTYKILVEANSLSAIAKAIFSDMAHK
jgi:hypothetical protein